MNVHKSVKNFIVSKDKHLKLFNNIFRLLKDKKSAVQNVARNMPRPAISKL